MMAVMPRRVRLWWRMVTVTNPPPERDWWLLLVGVLTLLAVAVFVLTGH